MTFYWWSHWFWITLLYQILLTISTVQTYPNQEIARLEYDEQTNTLRTKVYRTTTTTATTTMLTPSTTVSLPWATASPAVNTSGESLGLNVTSNMHRRTLEDTDCAVLKNCNSTTVNETNPNGSLNRKTSAGIDCVGDSKDCKESKVIRTLSSTKPITAEAGKLEASNFTNFTTAADVVRTQMADVETIPTTYRVPFTLENVNKEDELLRAENEHRSRKSKVLSAEYKHINRYINFSTDPKNLLLTSSASAGLEEFEGDDGNISSKALTAQTNWSKLISFSVCFAVFGVGCIVGTIVGIVLYRRRYYLNKPQALSEPSSLYIDDTTLRDNSDEMYSLDNDSFLNSLEAMTIQNYWTDTVKHTKL